MAPASAVDVVMSRERSVLDFTDSRSLASSLASQPVQLSIDISFGTCVEGRMPSLPFLRAQPHLVAIVLNLGPQSVASVSQLPIAYRTGALFFPLSFFDKNRSAAADTLNKIAQCDAGPTDCGSSEQIGFMHLLSGADAKIGDIVVRMGQ